MALPRPVVKAIRLTPPAASPVSDIGIVARRVHEHEAGRSDALGIIDDVHQRRGACFSDRAQRFLENVREAAGLVSGRRIVVEAAAEPIQIGLITGDESEQLFGNLPIARAPDQQMFRAEDLGGLRQNGRSAQSGQPDRSRRPMPDWR